MRTFASLLVAAALMACSSAFAATYHIDPAKGTADGDGSAARPWKTLEEVAKGALKKVQGGDTVLLHTGYHGDVTFSGNNASTVTIAAAEGEKPTLSRLTIPSGSNWVVRGLSISPFFGKEYKGNIVTFGEAGDSSKISIEDCYVFTAEDASNWDAKQWMAANGGINMGRNGRELTIRNCFVRNVRFGMALCAFDSLAEGNVISDFSADAMRTTRDGQTLQYNIIKNVYVSAKDGDDNHDDGIQCFLFNKGTGLVNNIKVVGNIIIAHENPNQKWQNALQGVGFFDGPLVKFVVTDNVVNVDSYQGIALYDAQNALVERNVVWAPDAQKVRPWITFGTKQKVAKDNVATNNFSSAYKLKQPGTVEEKNQASSAEIYNAALKKAYKTICEKFGEKHVAADRVKLVIK